MQSVRYLIVGAGVSGLSFANWCDDKDYLILEADSEIGGYCKTIRKDGFVWDYSGHFFHFKHKELEQYLLDRMPPDEVHVIRKQTRIWYGDRYVDFPFQKNIHQLPQDEFIECLYDLMFREEQYGTEAPTNFRDMLYRKLGRGIAEKFLIPYNEKLYATDLAALDVDAMGRFFPHADVRDIIRNFRSANNASYNDTFTYPRGGAIQYVNALKAAVPDSKIALNEALVSIDLRQSTATTTHRQIRYEALISSAPLPRLLPMTGMDYDASVLSWNRVLVFNLGFDRKGATNTHWVYFPQRDVSFYRIGYYDNIFHTDRMSLYVELGYGAHEPIDVDAAKARVLADLERTGITNRHELVADHHVVLDPAYVHITRGSMKLVREARDVLAAGGVHSIGRYGGWTYCSIEDNMIEARELARMLNRVPASSTVSP